MTFSSLVYCNNCGAANSQRAIRCFVCEVPLHAAVQETFSSWDSVIQVWEVVTGNTLFTYHGHANGVHALAWSPDGTRIVSAGRDKTVQVWDAITGRHLFTYHGHSSWVYAVAWSPDGARMASAGNDKTVQVWPPA